MAGETNKPSDELVKALRDLTNSVKANSGKESSPASTGKTARDPNKALISSFEKDMTESVRYLGKGLIGAFQKMHGNLSKEFDQIKIDTFADILESNQARMGSEIAARTSAVAKSTVILIADAAKVTATAFAGALLNFNKLWNQAMGGVQGALTAVKDTAMKVVEGAGKVIGIKGGGPIAGALGGLLDGFIQGIMFKFEDALKYKEMKRAVKMQLGVDSAEATGFANHMAGYYSTLGRQVSTEFTESFAGIGVVNNKVADDMIVFATHMKMGASETAQLLETYMTFGNTATQATDKLYDNFRKLQAAAKETGLPVKTMAGFISQASTNARFLNVDVALLGNTMANLSKKTKDLSNLGVDFRQHGATIMNDLATAGKNVSDAMHVFYGSKGGTQNISTGAAWAKSMFGEKAAAGITKTEGGGFTTGGMAMGEATQGNTMMIQKLEMMKSVMNDASAGASDDAEALMLQMKAAKDVFGLSDEAAKALAVQGKDEIAKLADNPEMSAQFKDNKQIMGEMQSTAVKSEALQRHLVNLNMAIVKILFEIPILIIGWFQKSKLFGSGDDKLYKGSLAALDKQGMEFKSAAKGAAGVLGSVAGNDMAYFGGRIDAVTDSMGGQNARDNKQAQASGAAILKNNPSMKGAIATNTDADKGIERAGGGPVSAGNLYSVGEGNKPELLMIPGNSGEVLSSDKVDKLAASGATGSGSGGVTINLSVHGVTKDQIMQQITSEVLRVLQ